MIAIPAVDLSGGRSVQWAGGLPETERVSIPDPAGVAARWWRTGFRTLHIVDLDAALGRDDNHAAVRELIASTGAVTQFGGGVRDREGIERAFAAGADRAGRGADELLLTSIDRDGSRRGYDLELTRRVASLVSVPVVASRASCTTG